MEQGTARAGVTDAALVRLLARLGNGAAQGGAAGLAEQLAGWLRWTDAMPLFTALQQPCTVSEPADEQDCSLEAAEADCRSVHGLLARSIADNAPWVVRPIPRARRPPARAAPAAMETIADFPFYRRHYQAQQQAMEDGIAPLRARLRVALQARTPALARLAAVDAVMEGVLGAQERRLLASVPPLLEKRFAQWRAQAQDGADGAWQQPFQQELQAVLLAELDLRWQPIAGLLDALRSPP